MDNLRSQHLFTLTLKVKFTEMIDIGVLPHGRRRIAPVESGHFEGARLKGSVLPGGADWVLNRADGGMKIDVRIALRTDDGAAIYMQYQGHFRAAPDVAKRFNRGEQLAPLDYYLRTVANFETAAPKYAWLNEIISVGSGAQGPGGVIYTLHEIL